MALSEKMIGNITSHIQSEKKEPWPCDLMFCQNTRATSVGVVLKHGLNSHSVKAQSSFLATFDEIESKFEILIGFIMTDPGMKKVGITFFIMISEKLSSQDNL